MDRASQVRKLEVANIWSRHKVGQLNANVATASPRLLKSKISIALEAVEVVVAL